MSFTRSRRMFAGGACALGLCVAAGALANEPGTATDAGSGAAAAVAGGGKATFWSRNNMKLSLSELAVTTPVWNAEVNAEDSRLAFTPEEQQELVQHLRGTLDRLVAPPAPPTPLSPELQTQLEPSAGPKPDMATVVATATPAALSLQARITQASMPNITRNLFVLALPIPIPGVRSLLRSRGGAGIDVAIVRPGDAEPIVSFQCDHQMGMISILDSYRRLAQAKTAMERCVETLARSAPEGRLVDWAPAVAAADTPTKVP
jgi:hypothetical protein